MRKKTNTLDIRDRYYDQIVSLRKQIASLDSAFQAKMKAKLDAFNSQKSQLEKTLQDAYEKDLSQLDALAQDAARKAALKNQAEVKPLLVNSAHDILPAVPAKSIHLPASTGVNPKFVPLVMAGPNLQEERQLTKQALSTWLGMNGYRLSTNPHDPDKTQEFAQWLNKFRLVPVPSGSAKFAKS